MTTQQTEMFSEPAKESQQIMFCNLSIHEKINHKANKCGFGRIVYLTRYNYFYSPLHKPKTDRLAREYWEHYRLTAGNFNRLDNWRKENINKQYKLI